MGQELKPLGVIKFDSSLDTSLRIIAAMKKRGVAVTTEASQLLAAMNLGGKPGEKCEVFIATTAQITGNRNGSYIGDLAAALKDQGLCQCPGWIGAQFWPAHLEEQGCEDLHVLMEKVKVGSGDFLLRLKRTAQGNSLRVAEVQLFRFWFPVVSWLICRPC